MSSGPILWAAWDEAAETYWSFSKIVMVLEAAQRSLKMMLNSLRYPPATQNHLAGLTLSFHPFLGSADKLSHGVSLLCSLGFSTPWLHTHVDVHSASTQHISFWEREKNTVFQVSAVKSFHVLHLSETCWFGQLWNSYRAWYQSIFKSIAVIFWQQTAAFSILLIHPHQAIPNSLGLTPVLNTCYT